MTTGFNSGLGNAGPPGPPGTDGAIGPTGINKHDVFTCSV